MHNTVDDEYFHALKESFAKDNLLSGNAHQHSMSKQNSYFIYLEVLLLEMPDLLESGIHSADFSICT